ncbi:MAG TPA: VWA domain-containing protein [Terriglobales bacterium]|nr:VWA domain-containing protein [Terriglobales bacterium]
MKTAIRISEVSSAKSIFVIICLLTMSTVAWGQRADVSAGNDGQYTISVSVDEVVLHMTVRNHRGNPVAGLGENDFKVLEDHVPQPIRHFSHEDVPVTVGMVIDNSGSMRPKRAEVIAAALAFAGSSNSLDQMFLINFNEHVSFGLPGDIPFTDQPDQLRTAMGTVKANGKTALYDAVSVALEHLKKGNRDKKVLIVVSDGADNASSNTMAGMLNLVTQSDAIIYALGIYEPDDPDNKNPHVLRELAKASGGEAFFPGTLREVVPICERIAHEIRNQYTLSYIPTNTKRDGRYRSIEVQVSGGLLVTTRAGYIAPLEATAGTAPETRK